MSTTSGPPPRTIRELLAATKPWLEKRGVDAPRLDAELLVAHALGMKRLDLFLDLDRPLSDDEVVQCRALVLRRGQREPVAQILGEREFFGLPFLVTADVLVPRPETEHLVELALERTPRDAEGVFIDVCTGSACVAIAILAQRPGLRAVATDVSEAALAVARRNSERHGMDARLSLRAGDLLGPCHDVRGARFILGNPPYIRANEKHTLSPEVARYEPALALFGEDADGLGHHRRILEQAHALMVVSHEAQPPSATAHAFVALEMGAGQAAGCRAIQVAGFAPCDVRQDLAGLDRIAVWSMRA